MAESSGAPCPGEQREEATGLKALQDIASGRRPQIPLGSLLGFTLVEAMPGRVSFDLRPNSRMLNSGGVVHGGVLGLVLDQAIGDAVRTLLPDDVRYVTVDLYLTYIRSVGADAVVRCDAWVTHMGTTTARTTGRILDEAGRVVCECMSTLFVLREGAPQTS